MRLLSFSPGRAGAASPEPSPPGDAPMAGGRVGGVRRPEPSS